MAIVSSSRRFNRIGHRTRTKTVVPAHIERRELSIRQCQRLRVSGCEGLLRGGNEAFISAPLAVRESLTVVVILCDHVYVAGECVLAAEQNLRMGDPHRHEVILARQITDRIER